jgi:hypothetical protein
MLVLSICTFVYLIRKDKLREKFAGTISFWVVIDAVTLIMLYYSNIDATTICYLFVFLDLVVNALCLLEIKSKFYDEFPAPMPTAFQVNHCEYALLALKFSVFILSQRISYYSPGVDFLIESGLDIAVLMTMLCYLYYILGTNGEVAPTISETFKGRYQIIICLVVYVGLRWLHQFALFCAHVVKDRPECSIFDIEFAYFGLNSVFFHGVDFISLNLIFLFDTGGRICSPVACYQSFIRASLVVVYVIIKVVLSWSTFTVHQMPLLITFAYFVGYYLYTERIIGDHLRPGVGIVGKKGKKATGIKGAKKELPSIEEAHVRVKANFTLRKRKLYQRMFKVNLTCLLYEFCFLMTLSNCSNRNAWMLNIPSWLGLS